MGIYLPMDLFSEYKTKISNLLTLKIRARLGAQGSISPVTIREDDLKTIGLRPVGDFEILKAILSEFREEKIIQDFEWYDEDYYSGSNDWDAKLAPGVVLVTLPETVATSVRKYRMYRDQSGRVFVGDKEIYKTDIASQLDDLLIWIFDPKFGGGHSGKFSRAEMPANIKIKRSFRTLLNDLFRKHPEYRNDFFPQSGNNDFKFENSESPTTI